jgi:HD superfamily phosphohydrolase
MNPIRYVPLLALGLGIFAAAGKVQAVTGIPPGWCEVAGSVVFLGAAAMMAREPILWVRGLFKSPALVKELKRQVEHLQSEHRREIQALAQGQSGPLHLRGSALASVWVDSRSTTTPTFLHRDDPIYGQLGIHKKLFPLLCHPLFQRLNYIRQLSFAYLTFPSASHTRLSHLFGVTKNAQEVLRKIVTKRVAYKLGEEVPETRQFKVDPEFIPLDLNSEQIEQILLKAQLCALLHDVGHGPFGHALDKLVPYLGKVVSSDPPDTLYSQKDIKQYLSDEISDAGFDPDNIGAILDKDRRDELSGFDVLIADLVASAVDIDRMDYLVRDAHMSGLQQGYINAEALREQMYPLKDGEDYKLVYAPAALTDMEELAQAHHNMYVHCYEHPRKLAAERLLMRAVNHLVTNGLRKDDLMLLTDDQLLALLSEFLAPGTAESGCFRAIRENVHFVVAAEYRLSRWNPRSEELEFNPQLSTTAKAWFETWGSGKKFLRKVYIDDPETWEAGISEAAGLAEEERWRVVVTVPAFDAKLRKESGALVVMRRPSGELLLDDFRNASSTLKNILTILDPERHVLRVMVAEDLRADASKFAKVIAAADELFKGQPASLAAARPTHS